MFIFTALQYTLFVLSCQTKLTRLYLTVTTLASCSSKFNLLIWTKMAWGVLCFIAVLSFIYFLLFIYIGIIYGVISVLDGCPMKHVKVSSQTCGSPMGLCSDMLVSDGSSTGLRWVSDWSPIIIIFSWTLNLIYLADVSVDSMSMGATGRQVGNLKS